MQEMAPDTKRARTTPPGEQSASAPEASASAPAPAAAAAAAAAGFALASSAEWPLLSRATPFPNEAGAIGFTAFSPGAEAVKGLDKPVLVVGAGGLGCEVLKNLALSGVRNIHVVDMDTIDLTNLNRQFLFRMKDVGAPKATTAAAFVMARVQGVHVTAHMCSVQELVKKMGDEELAKFGAVIGCLDSLDVRRWLNSKLCALAAVDEAGDLTALPVPYVDGGSEAFRGHVKVILPKFTACLECGIENFTPPTTIPMCTLVNKPRKPEHCVAYIMEVEWSKAFSRPFDTDSPVDMHWINDRAQERADFYGIPGVNYLFTLGAVKKIIPAIAATNAAVSAGCVAEVLKLLTGYSQTVENEYTLNAKEGNALLAGYLARKADCLACSHNPSASITLPSKSSSTLGDLLDKVMTELQLAAPSVGIPGFVPWTRPQDLEANRALPLAQLLEGYQGPLALAHSIFGIQAGKALQVAYADAP